MAEGSERVSVVLRVAAYVCLYIFMVYLTASPLVWLGGQFLGLTKSSFLGAVTSNFFALRIYERQPLVSIGLRWSAAARRNLALGLAGGMGSAALVVGMPLVAGAAHLRVDDETSFSGGKFLFVALLLLLGAAGEEMFFRGYGFQALLEVLGPYTTILPVGAIFALLHGGNPGSTPLALVNTGGFGVLFGYAYLRSRDLWLPIGLHYGWNLALPLFGVNVSGYALGSVGWHIEWDAGAIWSGGEYGPEGSVITAAVLVVLLVYLRMVRVGSAPVAATATGGTE